MSKRIQVTVGRFYDRASSVLGLERVSRQGGLRRAIGEPTVNRPGLALAGFRKHFPWRRVQVLGTAETEYVKTFPAEERRRRYAGLFRMRIPCVVLCRGYTPGPELLEAADEAGVPVFQSPLVTMKFISEATLILQDLFAPEDMVQGSMVDILGIGVIIRGTPGIGKSECVLALIERGYSLVSDDITRVRLSEERKILGFSPSVTREFMEVRGIGVINVPALFGIRSIRTLKQVDAVVTLKEWAQVEDVERVGLETQKFNILGVDLAHMIIPVRPGRDLARLVEVGAFYIKHRMVGGNPANDLEQRIFEQMKRPTGR